MESLRSGFFILIKMVKYLTSTFEIRFSLFDIRYKIIFCDKMHKIYN